MRISKNKVVLMSYAIRNQEGKLLEVRSPDDPVEFLVGHGQILQSLEDKLLGQSEGFNGEFVFGPDEAHGEYRVDLVVEMDRKSFPSDIHIEPGMKFESWGPEGDPIALHVVDVQGDSVWVDGNHPLAGETLKFDIRILEIREAAQEEIVRGQVLTHMQPLSTTRH